MPTPKQPNGSKPNVMWAELPQIFTAIPQVFYQRPPLTSNPMPVLVLPMPSKRAAMAKKKWEAMGREQKVEAMEEAYFNATGSSNTRGFYAILALIEGEPTP